MTAQSCGLDVAAEVADAPALRAALAELPPREREAVVLRTQWQLSVAEAAEIVGLSSGAVKRYTADGLRRLHERPTSAPTLTRAAAHWKIVDWGASQSSALRESPETAIRP